MVNVFDSIFNVVVVRKKSQRIHYGAYFDRRYEAVAILVKYLKRFLEHFVYLPIEIV